MRPFRMLATVLCLTVFFILVPDRGAASSEATLGGVTIYFPDLDGYSSGEQLPAETVELIAATVPRVNRLLALYVSNEDVARILKGEAPAFYRYIMVQTSRQYEGSIIGADDFTGLARSVKSEQNGLLDLVADDLKDEYGRISRSFSRYLDTAVDLGLENMAPLGVFIDRKEAVGFASLARVTAMADGVQHSSTMAGSTALVNARSKLLFVYVYSGFNDDRDVKWVQDTTTRLVDGIIALNP